MAVGADLLLAVAFVAGVFLIFVVAAALKTWVFELSPREWGYSIGTDVQSRGSYRRLSRR